MSEGSLEPTPKRLDKARSEGDFGASGAPGSALALFAAVLAFPSLGLFMANELRTSIRAATGYASLIAPDASEIGAREIASAVLLTSLPLVALVAGVAGTSTALETRFGFSVARLVGRHGARIAAFRRALRASSSRCDLRARHHVRHLASLWPGGRARLCGLARRALGAVRACHRDSPSSRGGDRPCRRDGLDVFRHPRPPPEASNDPSAGRGRA